MITQNETDRIIADMQVAELTKAHNIHLMAMMPIITLIQTIQEDDAKEDIQSTIRTVLYDLECMDDLLHENADRLWKVKEYHEKLKRDAKQ